MPQKHIPYPIKSSDTDTSDTKKKKSARIISSYNCLQCAPYTFYLRALTQTAHATMSWREQGGSMTIILPAF